jgi:hypothetical protein
MKFAASAFGEKVPGQLKVQFCFYFAGKDERVVFAAK